MATLTDAAAFAQDDQARPALMAGIVQAAVQIMTEAGDTAFHDQRVTLATHAIRNPASVVDAFAWAVSTNPAIVDEWTAFNRTQAITDFAFGISSVWNAVAGAATLTTTDTTTP